MFESNIIEQGMMEVKFNRTSCGSNSVFLMESQDGSFMKVIMSLESVNFEFHNAKTGKKGSGSLASDMSSFNISVIFHKMAELFEEELEVA